MAITNNLPPTATPTSDDEVRNFFDKYFLHQITFPTNQIDAVVGYFLKRGFDEQASRSTAIVLLNQARLENINPLQLIDTLKGVSDVQLSQVVAEVLNVYRDKTSVLGFKTEPAEETFENRNVIA
jgi:hypothetical protein